MANAEKRPLKVFLCHASGDKPPVRELYKRLTTEGVDAWLDQEKLLPGQDWRMEIPRAVREADVVVICLSKKSITKEGYVQKEIKFALDIAEEKPEGTIFLIPARLEDCPVPDRLNRWQWVDLYDDNGFIKLLRSLKLRADAVDASVEPILYFDSAKELDRKLEQWYTEGLAAFYTEDWDKACQRFQSILSERPNHRNAAEKLEEAERQGHLSKLYEQASAAVRGEDWGTAIQTLEELTQRTADYKDAAQLLRNARKQKQLRELYTEARRLHTAQQWEAVVRVFEQISSIEPNYPDADGLLPSAQQEVTEFKRIADLNHQYGLALREMDAGNWVEARRLLESVHKSQTGFLETEKLLKKVEKEIVKEEERRRQNDKVNTLYEQAHGLFRAKKWRNALEKMEEIHKLDEYFPDVDGIGERAQKELEREEQEAERQNKLAALYAEAVKLLKEEKYQEALDKWGEVRAIDPKYPDRQWVGRTAKRKLGMSVRQIPIIRPNFSIQNLGIGWFILLAAFGFGLARLVHINLPATETGWVLRGGLHGLIAALIVQRIIPEWKWKSSLVFAVCWAVLYHVTRWVILEFSAPLLADITFSLAPVLSFVIMSIWTKREIQWRTITLIFLGWVLAWLIGQSMAGYLNPVMNGSLFRWVISDALAGGIGLWITVDLLGKKSIADDIETDTASAPGTTWLLVWAFLGFVILRLIWDASANWLRIWDAPIPNDVQIFFLFVLGACFGGVVALTLKKVTPGWKWHHSLIVIAGWALGFDAAFLAIPTGINFDSILMAISGLSLAAALKLAKPSIPPLKLTLVFVSWVLAKIYGVMLADYLRVNLDLNSNWIGDSITVLLGLLATLGIYEYRSNRLIKLTSISVLGFALGNFAGVALTRMISINLNIEMYIQYALFGFAGGAVFASPSRDWKKILIQGGVCAILISIGSFAASLLHIGYLSLGNGIRGALLGLAFGLSTRKISIIPILMILGAAIFTISSVYIARLNYTFNVEAVIRGAMVGLVLGFGYAYLTRHLENIKLAD